MDREARPSWEERLRAAAAWLAVSGSRLGGWFDGHRQSREPRAVVRGRKGGYKPVREIHPPSRENRAHPPGRADVPAIIHKDWVVLVPPVARTVLFVVLAVAWHDQPW